MTHWALGYIGKQWQSGACGPDYYDCWGLVRGIMADRYGVVVPVVPEADTESILQVAASMMKTTSRDHWLKVDVPEEGDVVTIGRARYPSHCGIWVAADGGGVLHCERGAGVCFSTLDGLKLSGWGLIDFYRYQGEPCKL